MTVKILFFILIFLILAWAIYIFMAPEKQQLNITAEITEEKDLIIREPAAIDNFYSADKQELSQTIDNLLSQSEIKNNIDPQVFDCSSCRIYFFWTNSS